MRTRKAVLDRSTAEYRAELELWQVLSSNARELAEYLGGDCTLAEAIKYAEHITDAVRDDVRRMEEIENELDAMFADFFKSESEKQPTPKTDAA